MRKTTPPTPMTTPEPAPPPPPPAPTEAELAKTDAPIQDDYGSKLLAELTAAFRAAPRADAELGEKRRTLEMQLGAARDVLRQPNATDLDKSRAEPAVKALTAELAALPNLDEAGRRDALVALVKRHGEVSAVRMKIMETIAPLHRGSVKHGLSLAEGRRLDKLRETLQGLNQADLDLVRARSELDTLVPGHGLETLATLARAGKLLRDAAAAGRESVVARVRALADAFATEERTLRTLARTATWSELSAALEPYR